jgi:argininosuccinate synthase
MRNNKVVLAFSGGLDTSYCVAYLTRIHRFNVTSILIDTGGFSPADLLRIESTAKSLGVNQHIAVNAEKQMYDGALKYLIYGNVLRNNTYPLSVSVERAFQAMAAVDLAQEIDAQYLAHGSTGAGNDQVRFDIIFHTLMPDAEILTPIRDQKLSREQEIQFLQQSGIIMDWSKAEYSINKGLWGTSVGGKETLTSDQPLPEEAFPSQITEESPRSLIIEFERGEIAAVDGIKFASPVEAIRHLNEVGGSYGIGRDMHIGDTIIGIKGRVAFEAPAALMIIKAHQALEKHVLTKWQQHWKDQLANWYGMMLHEGQFLDPVMRDIEAYLQNSQERVTGTVELLLNPQRFSVQGVKSEYDMMSGAFGVYGEMHTNWSGEDVRGFARIASNQARIARIAGNKE